MYKLSRLIALIFENLCTETNNFSYAHVTRDSISAVAWGISVQFDRYVCWLHRGRIVVS